MNDGTRTYINESQRTRMIIRTATRPDGFCLIVDKDKNHFRMMEKVLTRASIRSFLASSADDAITCLHEKGGDVICAIIDIKTNGSGNGVDVVHEIEKHHNDVPYIVHTRDAIDATDLSRKFPRANVILKGDDFGLLLHALGVAG